MLFNAGVLNSGSISLNKITPVEAVPVNIPNNDKNDSSILMWSYMINNLYQQTLNEIAQFSNEQMAALNKVFLSWKNTMEALATAIDKEKGKLGLS